MAALFNPDPYDRYRDRLAVRAGFVTKACASAKIELCASRRQRKFFHCPQPHERGEAWNNETTDGFAGRTYDLSNRPAKGAVMDRTKPLQEGVRVKLPSGVTWAQLAGMTPDQIRDKSLFPQGFLPLPMPTSPRGAWSFRSLRFRN